MNRYRTRLFLMRGSPSLRASRPFKRLGWGAAALALVSALLVMDSSALAASGSDLSAHGLEARSVSDGVELSWDEPIDLAEQVTGYRILRRRLRVGEHRLGELVADTGSALTAYRDTDVTSATTYVYRVVALRGDVAAPWSKRAKLTYEAPAVSPRAAEEQEGSGQLKDDAGELASTDEPEWTPKQLRATGLVAEASPGSVVLTWDAPEGDADAVDGYEILRRRVNRGEKVLQTLVVDTGTTDTTYVDRSANEEGVKYAYRVKALRNGTASVWSVFTNAIGLPAATFEHVVTNDEHETSEQEICPDLEDPTDVLQACHLPDPNLRTEIEQTLQNSPGDDITLGDMETLTSLDLSYNQLSSIDVTGLERATNLTKLNLDDNQLTQITGLGKLTSLTELAIFKNELETIDVSGLSNLVSLDLRYNKLTNITGLTDLTSLTSLLLRSNKLTSIDVTGLTSLKRLYLHTNEFTRVTGLTTLTALTSLDMTFNQLTSIDVTGLTKLEDLNVFYNQLTHITGLTDLTSLTTLTLSYNYLTSIDVTGLTALTEIAVSHNRLTSIDLTGLTPLTELDLSVNRLTSIDLTDVTALTELDLNWNRLTSVDVTGLTALTALDLSVNKLTSINLTGLTELSVLILCCNDLTQIIGLESLTNLSVLKLASNDLDSFDASVLPKLKSLYLENNNLSSINVGGLTSLITLELRNNDLTTIDVSDLTNLKYLKLGDNPLTEADIIGLRASTFLTI